ncbi:Molybdopterin synthase [Lentibacillus sp. JNUCC-1]|uniref:molybdenum cofactor biosynthesis protein MoaE n=1 Tax=Lentibacillus sp. JNUCC-1 TaxID=2654513 RepID=UPI0012E97FB9|nr:molybdenum cofactor biosynthesis protein MoaE [Lentibacillus sp. JNUCC-1]MUV36532.1 Molybdopterin synthase [Lentibacillus sp. JNUCC-1]
MEKNFWITEDTIDVQDVINKVTRPEAGAVNVFTGIVREFTRGKQTLFLEYQAYKPMAEKKLAEIGREIEERWGDVQTAIVHRTGRLEISDVAVAIAVSTPHRKDAFEASSYAIERIKEIVPIWKKENWADGTKWMGDQKEQVSYRQGVPSEEAMYDG